MNTTRIDPKSIDAGFLAACLIRANEAAINASGAVDGGSCCLDTALVRLDGVPQRVIDEAKRLSGIDVGEKMTGFWKGYRFVWTALEGQGFKRSAMSEAAYKSLQADGLQAHHWQQMD